MTLDEALVSAVKQLNSRADSYRHFCSEVDLVEGTVTIEFSEVSRNGEKTRKSEYLLDLDTGQILTPLYGLELSERQVIFGLSKKIAGTGEPMTDKKFIEEAKKCVAQDANTDRDDKVSKDDIYLVWYSYVAGNYKALLSSNKFGDYYEVTYIKNEGINAIDKYSLKSHTDLWSEYV